MDDSPKHIIILPYYCDDEVTRYLKIANRLKAYPQPAGGYHFLLASSPKAKPSYELLDAYSAIGNAIPFTCPTQVFGYPQGPTAMFWDCMDYLATNHSGQPGFGLWMESDMAPSHPNWIDRLAQEWFTGSPERIGVENPDGSPASPGSRRIPTGASSRSTPIMMGCYVPEVYKHRVFKQKKLILQAHINGGACYSMDFASHMPAAAREGVFDMAVFQYAQQMDRVRASCQISFSTLGRVRRDLLDPGKVLLHGFMQDKDQFIEQCCQPITAQERAAVAWHPWLDHWETIQRSIRVRFVRRGHRAMLENMFLAKRKFELNQQADRPQAKKIA